MARSKTIWKDGQLFAEYENGELTYLNPDYRPPARSNAVCAPMVMRDLGEYRSIIDGTLITSRSHHREHMRQHDVIEVGNECFKNRPPPEVKTHDIGQAIKRRLEEVRELPQVSYDQHVQQQAAEHAAVAALATATEAS